MLRWARLRQAAGEPGRAARRDLAVGLALAASWLAVRGLYSAYHWTANAVGTTLQFARFYVPALGATSLLGAWLVTRIPGRAWPAGLTTTVVIAAMFGLGAWAYHDMTAHPFPACASSATGCIIAASPFPAAPKTAGQNHVLNRTPDAAAVSSGPVKKGPVDGRT